MTPSLADLRQDYRLARLDRADLAPEPFAQFQKWFSEAQAAQIIEPNAMTLATVNREDQPSSRTVLLKALDARGFTFFTNYESRKAQELAAQPRAALTFLWKELERQVNITGTIEKVSRAESAAYFATRPHGSQLGAHASAQSQIIADRATLEAQFRELEARYPIGHVPLPETWGGFRLLPTTVEFWQGRSSRLHDRLRYALGPDGWAIARLCP
jgi:pyridoxamine 5'-phosphate oxidase